MNRRELGQDDDRWKIVLPYLKFCAMGFPRHISSTGGLTIAYIFFQDHYIEFQVC